MAPGRRGLHRADIATPAGTAARVGTTSDINPRDPATLRDGGNLRLPLMSFPDNFNT